MSVDLTDTEYYVFCVTDLKYMADRQEWKGKDPKKYMKERLHNTKKSFFNLPLKE